MWLTRKNANVTASLFSIISALIIVLLFYKRNMKRFSILNSLIKTLGKLEERSSSWETTPLRCASWFPYATLVFSQLPACLDQAAI